MKYPCKTCLVQAACDMRKECDEYTKFIGTFKDVWTPLISGLTSVVLMVSAFGVLILYGEPAMLSYFKTIWISSAIINVIIKIRMGFNTGIFVISALALAPLMTPFLIFHVIVYKKYKRA